MVDESDYSSWEDYLDEKDEDNEMYRVPLFDGRAGMVARARLPAKHFDIFAEVSTVCGEGAVLSASGPRDYLWFGLIDDNIVLRWDAGSGPLDLRAGKVRTDGRTRISIRRYRKDAVLKLESSTLTGSSPGRMSSLDLDPFIYVGHPPDNATRWNGTGSLSGFVGCVHRLRVSGRDVIPPSRGLPLTAHGLRPCTPHNLARLVCP
ncbi:hypothetical protein JYU34_003425 [Plutella xylostella]|uniref:Laminin G domain-containing protein n=2 Tax=Plutella xylostella TaxID=51655 RepID=A0ABQ7R002_PLUXY|nr:hypothetical protein JYU34_003425 [Plutella xylostella]